MNCSNRQEGDCIGMLQVITDKHYVDTNSQNCIVYFSIMMIIVYYFVDFAVVYLTTVHDRTAHLTFKDLKVLNPVSSNGYSLS